MPLTKQTLMRMRVGKKVVAVAVAVQLAHTCPFCLFMRTKRKNGAMASRVAPREIVLARKIEYAIAL